MARIKLTERELRRYEKQIMLDDIGPGGQERLKNARVLVIGAGGLGCPVLQYLTAAGIGNLGICEFDMVSESNLQRQVLYGSDDLGKLKSVIAKKRLEALNPLITIEIMNLRLDKSNATRILKNFDIAVDATDNIDTRYFINDACVELGIPMVHGSIYKYEGVVSVFNYKGKSTYRDYNQQKKEDSKNPQPADVGLPAVLPGITGTFMANEVIKIITGAGEVLAGKFLHFDIRKNTFRVVTIPYKHK